MKKLEFDDAIILVNPSRFVMDKDRKPQTHLGLVLDEETAELARKSGYSVKHDPDACETGYYMVLRAPSKEVAEKLGADIWDGEKLERFLGRPHRAVFLAKKLRLVSAAYRLKGTSEPRFSANKLRVLYIEDIETEDI